jgi:hypothetical protein
LPAPSGRTPADCRHDTYLGGVFQWLIQDLISTNDAAVDEDVHVLTDFPLFRQHAVF